MSVTMKCDICGGKMPESACGDNLLITVRTKSESSLSIISPTSTTKFDICDSCGQGLINMINSLDGKDYLCGKVFDYS